MSKESSKESSKKVKELSQSYKDIMTGIGKLRDLSDTVMSGLLESDDVNERERVVLVAAYIMAIKPSSDASEMVFKEMITRLKADE